jgi:hypothetical protein
MGISYNPQIPTNNIVLCLDSANTKSYPGSGATWTDLSPSKTNASLSGSPVFSSANNGTLVFDGTDDSASVSFNAATMDFSLAQTICMWIRPATGSGSARRNPYNQAYGGSGTITHEPGGGFNYYFGTNGGNGDPYVGVASVFTVVANETAFICVTRDQATNTTRWYKNGLLSVTTTAGGYAATNNGSSPILIGTGYTSGRFIGNIYHVALYNRALTADEVEQNFNALRGRYGV